MEPNPVNFLKGKSNQEPMKKGIGSPTLSKNYIYLPLDVGKNFIIPTTLQELSGRLLGYILFHTGWFFLKVIVFCHLEIVKDATIFILLIDLVRRV